ncbi:MAG: hypothetical protein IJJ01_07500 [Firmicutes bacterium]|nr:hypothetical protein [Bacillota bacterium]
MLTSSQRDILAGIMTFDVLYRTEDLDINDIITIYETNREAVEYYAVGRNEQGREESLT